VQNTGKLEVIGFGALNMDYLHKVDQLVLDGETDIQHSTRSPGGSAANTIYGLSGLGVKAGLIGAVGDDEDGKAILADLKQARVDISHIRIVDEVPTGFAIGFVDEKGRRALYISPGANSRMEREDIELAHVAQARILHLTSFVDEKQLAVQEWLVESTSPQVQVSFAPGSLYTRRGAEALSRILRRTAFLFVNEDEAKDLGGVCGLFDRGCQVVVITLGEKGCRVVKAAACGHPEKDHLIEAIAGPVVDTTGAGDAFAAGFLHGVLGRKDLVACGRLGNLVASRCIAAMGPRASLLAVTDVSRPQSAPGVPDR
jgi:ribokinase